jgi:predicted dehydrogenase
MSETNASQEPSIAAIKAGVIGAGVFGGYHAGKYAAHPRVAFQGVYDVAEAAREALAAKHGVRAFASLEDLLAEVDAVTVATPAVTHGEFARRALQAGKHVLVEKPIAATLDDADAVLGAARAAGTVLQVGHQERFVFEAMGLLAVAEVPRRIEARRMGPFSPRGSDVSVTLDLMIHDLDLVRLLAGRAPVARLDAQIERRETALPDRVRAELAFENGCAVVLEASRLHDTRERVMRVEYESGTLEVDFVAKTFVNSSAHALNPDFAETETARDSLGAGVNAFIDAIEGKAPPAVSGEDGREALALALQIDAAG